MIKIELSHDILAKTVYDKSSAEDKRILKIERLINDRYQRYQERTVLMDKADLEYIAPFLSLVIIPEEQHKFIKKSKARVKAIIRRKRLGNLAIAILLILLTLIAIGTVLYATDRILKEIEKADRQIQQAKIAKQEAEKEINTAKQAQENAEQQLKAAEEKLEVVLIEQEQASKKVTQARAALGQAKRALENARSEMEKERIRAENVQRTAQTKLNAALAEKKAADKAVTVARQQAFSIISEAEKARKEKQQLINIAEVSFLSNQAIRLLNSGKPAEAKAKTLKARSLWNDTLQLGHLQNADNYAALHACLKHQEGQQFRLYQDQKNPRSFRAIAVNANAKMAVGDEAGIVRIFKNTNQPLSQFSKNVQLIELNRNRNDLDEIYTLAFIKQQLLIGTLEGKFAIFDTRQIQQKRYHPNLKKVQKDPALLYAKHYNAPIKAIAISPNKQQIAFFTSQTDSLYVLNTSGNTFKTKINKKIPKISAITWQNDQQLWIGTTSGLQLYHLPTNTLQIPTINLPKNEITAITTSKITAIASRKNLLVMGSNEGKIWIIRQDNGILKQILNGDYIKSHNSGVSALAFNTNNSKIVSSSHDGTLKIWNIPYLLHKNDEPIVLSDHTRWIFDVSFSQDGHYIYSIGEDKTLRQWLTDANGIKSILQ